MTPQRRRSHRRRRPASTTHVMHEIRECLRYREMRSQRAELFRHRPATRHPSGLDEAKEPTVESSPAIELIAATKRFATPSGGVYTALRDLDVDGRPGEFCAVVGPTGCGKSTTLTLVSGLERPSAGQVTRRRRAGTGITPGVGFMFQNDAVFPWKSVLDNVAAARASAAARPRRRRRRARLGAARRPGRFRGPLPAPALRRHAQAGRAGAEPDQRAEGAADGRAVLAPWTCRPARSWPTSCSRCGTAPARRSSS